MKRRDLRKKIEGQENIFIWHGGKHDYYQNPEPTFFEPVPRYSEINENP